MLIIVIMLILGDATRIPLADESVQCVVTSPPYWGLRDYGIAPRVWGGRDDCEHGWAETIILDGRRYDSERDGKNVGQSQESQGRSARRGNYCRLCSAWRGSLGLEPTPELYVEHIVAVFREVRRVLRKDGTVWLNLGDSYNGGNKGNSGLIRPGDKQGTNIGSWSTRRRDSGTLSPTRAGGCDLKVKDLVGIPWRVAFALQADGWWLRSDIIWSKPNPMPESVRDRPTRSHEYLFLLAKSERYYFDQAAVKEAATCDRLSGSGPMTNPLNGDRNDVNQCGDYRLKTSGKHSKTDAQAAGRRLVESVKTARANGASHDNPFGSTRNIRSVWTIATQPYSEAHFATFPEDLVSPCILAGCPEGGIVFDPFAGSGTVVKVPQDLGRIGIGMDLKPEYLAMAKKRTAQQGFGAALRGAALEPAAEYQDERLPYCDDCELPAELCECEGVDPDGVP